MSHIEMMKADSIIEELLLSAHDDATRPHASEWIHSSESRPAARAMAGDDEAFAALVRPYLNLFTCGIHRILQDAQDTQEALRKALLDIRAELNRFHGKSRFCSWAYRICLDEALRFRRSRMHWGGNYIKNLIPRDFGEGCSMPQKGSEAWVQCVRTANEPSQGQEGIISSPSVWEQQENQMKTISGLWIDHRKAVIATVTADGEETMEIRSNVERQPGRDAGIRSTVPFEARQVPADDSQERAFTGHLNLYYDRVVAVIRDAETILIFGPGEAKGQLKRRIELAKLGGHILEMETADEMTDRQITAKVREHFLGEVSTHR